MVEKHSSPSSSKVTLVQSTPPHEGEESSSASVDFSPDAVRAHIITPTSSSKYVGTPISIKDLLFRSAKSGDILVAKLAQDSEFILHGVFQIARSDFFFTPDGSFKPGNSIKSAFKDVKLSCLLSPPPPAPYEFATNDFTTCIENIRTIEKIIKPDKKDEIKSCLISSPLGLTHIKLTHALFEPKHVILETSENENGEEELQNDNDESATIKSDTPEDLGEEFDMETWPVNIRCEEALRELLPSYDLCPLPAYDKRSRLLPPTLYESKLKGATVEVHFALIHHYIKLTKSHVYIPTLRYLQILSAPAPLPTSPYKHHHVTGTYDKGKRRQS